MLCAIAAFFVQAASAHSPVAHSDHLNTPRLIADAAGTTVWRWDQQEPFGNSPADQNPSGLGVFDLPLRLPGQTYDAETGFHYNYYRDFDPSLGIYKQSDPGGTPSRFDRIAVVLDESMGRVHRIIFNRPWRSP